jgi:transcriptional regulator with XRE-family HTH domain
MSNLEVFAINLRRKRKLIGLSQEQLGLESEIDRTYIQLLESAKANPSLKVMEKLSSVLNISIVDFFMVE